MLSEWDYWVKPTSWAATVNERPNGSEASLHPLGLLGQAARLLDASEADAAEEDV
jgi:hypothetical protein